MDINPFSYTRAQAVTPDNANPIPTPDPGFPHARGLYIGTGGTLKVKTAGGDTVSFAAVAAGHLYIEVVQVFATGTTATGIVALY